MAMQENITAARKTDGAAPVSKENNQRQDKIKTNCSNFDLFTSGIFANNQTSKT